MICEQIKAIDPKARGCNRVDLLAYEDIMNVSDVIQVMIVQMFNEREDYMMILFGLSGRTQESIDYWGE